MTHEPRRLTLAALPPHLTVGDAEDLAVVLAAVADPIRLKILLLLRGGPMYASDLIPLLGRAQPTVSRCVHILAEQWFISRRQEGSRVELTLDRAAVKLLGELISAVAR